MDEAIELKAKPKVYEAYRFRVLDHVDYEIHNYLDLIEQNQYQSRLILILPALNGYWQSQVKKLVMKHFNKELEILEISSSASSNRRIGICLCSYLNMAELESEICETGEHCKGQEVTEKLRDPKPGRKLYVPPPLRKHRYQLGRGLHNGNSSVWTHYEQELIDGMKSEQPESDEFWTPLSDPQVKEVMKKIGPIQIIKPSWYDFGFDVAIDIKRGKYDHIVEAYGVQIPDDPEELKTCFEEHIGKNFEFNFNIYKVNIQHAIVVFSDVTGRDIAMWLTVYRPEKFRPVTLACGDTKKKLLCGTDLIATPDPDMSASSTTVARVISLALGKPRTS